MTARHAFKYKVIATMYKPYFEYNTGNGIFKYNSPKPQNPKTPERNEKNEKIITNLIYIKNFENL